ncbi:hypothetical protein FACS189485_14640 [Spirochaetia bacterium]|nr:hypothetical protein FACS189485_14640 [Spirochaetia bacterium]
MFNFKSEQDKADFMHALEKAHQRWDPEVKLPKDSFSSPGYHTTLTGGFVHSTCASLDYAVALLDSGIPEYIDRGKEVALKVASLQDTNEASKTYGIWSWYYEEPLEKMSPPDWNWADFCGKRILQILKDHKEHLSDKEFETLKTSVYHACKSIIRRNMGPHYTNIAIMGTYVTHLAGELLGFGEILAYAKERLVNFVEYSKKNNNFTEYNSPTYTLLAAEDLGMMYRDVKDPESKKLIYECLKICWRTILTHQHYPTRQWAAPHRRNYTELLAPAARAKLQRALKGKIDYIDGDEYHENLEIETFRLDIQCPDEFLDEFLKPGEERIIFERFAGEKQDKAFKDKAAGTANADNAEIGFTYLNKNFALGSCHKDTTWNKKRNQVLYFGTKESPFCFRPTLLHDFYDYSSGVLISVQHKGLSVGALGFSTNSGDTHCNLDMVKDATIRVSDLRLRFSLIGDTSKIDEFKIIDPPGYIGPGAFRDAHQGSSHGSAPDQLGPGLTFRSGPVTVNLNIPKTAFGPYPLSYGLTKEKGVFHFDVIFFSGRACALDFRTLEKACIGFTLEVNDTGAPAARSTAIIEDGLLKVSLSGEKTIMAAIPAKPAPIEELYAHSWAEIDGKDVNDLV